MNVYLDDERITPHGWIRTYTPKETIALLKAVTVKYLSLDHDLGDDKGIGTGYDVLLWIEEQVFTNDKFIPPHIVVHSANPSARIKMEMAIESINKKFRLNCNCV